MIMELCCPEMSEVAESESQCVCRSLDEALSTWRTPVGQEFSRWEFGFAGTFRETPRWKVLRMESKGESIPFRRTSSRNTMQRRVLRRLRRMQWSDSFRCGSPRGMSKIVFHRVDETAMFFRQTENGTTHPGFPKMKSNTGNRSRPEPWPVATEWNGPGLHRPEDGSQAPRCPWR